MKFRTEIEVAPLPVKIDHTRRGFSVGSCFADRIAGKLAGMKFPIVSNPTGVLYNPFSIADALEQLGKGGEQGAETAAGAGALAAADYLIITFGTAWVYEQEGRVVANCRKRPAHLFTRRRLSTEEIVGRFDALLDGPLAGKQVIFTLSPIRHLKDGFEQNSLSKATLRLAIAHLIERHPDRTYYFPAYETLNDDLRDYRFYGPDLAHPSAEAIEYIWGKFAGAAFDADTRKLLVRIERLARAAAHRPFDPESAEHEKFRRSMLAQTQELAAEHPELDLSAETELFAARA